jgi:hypothetical protein
MTPMTKINKNYGSQQKNGKAKHSMVLAEARVQKY